ncbi:homoserine O-acetyltransferase MetA [Robinsoniella sp. KNHs210]|uniref:homoserine O-acetyltransferase MetA n=1 Tax=Robinsoniella sp. KNHs210 TaxID=1469950 RepID=UPI000480A4D7|nr:homoserine O-succinyltransferase [Robinsoniella sp. KNHs210]
MPIKVQGDLPAKEILEQENIFVMDENRAMHQDIRPIEIAILNLMPLKEETELQLLRSLSNTPLQVNITFLMVTSHESKNTATSHLNQFYITFDDVKKRSFDGMIITGAPVEQMEFEDVDYWEELTHIMEWTKTNVTSTIHLCWGAQAALYYHYGLQKKPLDRKMFGLYWHRVLNRKIPLVRGFDDMFLAPHSRHTEVPKESIEACDDLMILADSEEAGVFLAMNRDGKQIFVMGHPEYDRVTLDGEYKRDVGKGLDIDMPMNYYQGNDPENKPVLMWRSHANNMYTNWLNYYVYQATPYSLNETGDLKKNDGD